MIEGSIAGTVLFWGLAGILAGKAARNTSALSILVWGPIISLPLLLPLWLFGADAHPPWQFLLLAGSSSLFVFIAWGLYVLALQRGPTSSVVAIGSVYPLFALLLLWVIGEPSPGKGAVFGVLLIALGLFWFQSKDVGWSSPYVFLLSLGAAILWSFWSVFDFLALQYGGAIDLIFWTLVFSAFYGMLLGVFLHFRKKLHFISGPGAGYRLASGIATLIASFFFYYALEGSLSPAVVISLTSTYPIVTMLLAVLLKEEKIELQRTVALFLVVAGVAALYL